MDIKSISLLICSFLVVELLAAGSVESNSAYGGATASQQGSSSSNQQGRYGVDLNQYLNQFGGMLGQRQSGAGSSSGSQKLIGLDQGLEIFGDLTKGFSTTNSNTNSKKGETVSEASFLAGIQKFMSNPNALVEYISATFQVPSDKLKTILAKDGLLAKDGHPISKSMQILETVLVPDECRLKVLCQIGLQFGRFKEQIPYEKIPSSWFEGSGYYKALSKGLLGEDCLVAYTTCKQGDELSLAMPFANLSYGYPAGKSVEKKESSQLGISKGISLEALSSGLSGLDLKSSESKSEFAVRSSEVDDDLNYADISWSTP